MCAKPASPLGEKHIFENQSVKLGLYHIAADTIWFPITITRRNNAGSAPSGVSLDTSQLRL